MDDTAFRDAYKSLNKAQKEAVDTIEGPVMVVAGPGTGKTQILTLRIANILLKTDTPPDGVLALTFTESGAKAMRERLRTYIGTDAYRVPIFTFHGFAQTLIGQYPDAYERVIGGRPATDIEKISIIESIVNDGTVKALRPMGHPSYYVKPLRDMIGTLKQEYISPTDLGVFIASQEEALGDMEQYHTKGAHEGKQKGAYTDLEKSITKNRELKHVYERYDALLSEQHLYDFEDMIVETLHALEHDENMLRDLQEQYLYVLADEHQDVNGSQNKILELLASFHESPNLFAVGDEKQAIYRFQGASLENFLYFTDTFKDTKVISLTQNYRSGQAVLDVAHSLIEVEDGPLKDLRVPLSSETGVACTIEMRDFSHQAVEDDWVVSAVSKALEEGTTASDIAVIVRTNREVEQLSTLLRKQDIAVHASADSDILNHSITTTVRGLIDAVLLKENNEALFTVLHGAFWEIPSEDLVRICSARSYNTPLIHIISNPETLEEIGVTEIDKILKISNMLAEARKRDVSEPPHRVLEYILQESGLLTHLMTHDPLEGVRVVRRLYDEIEEMVMRDGVSTLHAVSIAFSKRASYGLPLNAPFISVDSDAVVVMTAHKSKGLEFHTVIIPHMVDRTWGGGMPRSYFDVALSKSFTGDTHEKIEDEQRLFYVALTRAKEKLLLSHAQTNADGQALLPSRLIDELWQDAIEQVSTDDFEKNFKVTDALLNASHGEVVSTAFLKHIFEQRGFSATSLNNYLRNPWDYFYRNILRIPEIQPAHMQYGTAVHNTLEYMTKTHARDGVLITMTQVKKKLEQELGRLPVSTEEFTRLLEKSIEELTVYREHLSKTLPKHTKEELAVSVVLETGDKNLPEIRLSGKLDRLDLSDDGQAIRVIDYKTGKPKTRNVIEGKTKSSDGDYKRQLVFYALLLQLHDDERYRCNEGVLSFVQADAHGNVKEESFTITEQEITALKDEIIASAQSFISGTFLKEPCEESDYCELARRFQEHI